MRSVAVVISVLSLLSVTGVAAQAGASSAASTASIKACAVLTKELALKVTPEAKRVYDPPPHEEPAGQGTSCTYHGIMLQIDPFPGAAVERSAKSDKKWVAVSGVGDVAWFRDNDGRWAEVMAVAGAHTFTIQMDVPDKSTAERIKPNVIQLANAVVPKLK